MSASTDSRKQTKRAIDALRAAGAPGSHQPAFVLPNVVAGGAPITRLPTRNDELRKQDYMITTGGRRNRCNVSVLVAEPPSVPILEDDEGAPLGALVGATPARSTLEPEAG